MTDFALPAPARVRQGTLARRPRQTYSFGDLVHTRWHHKKNPTDELARARYEEIRATFEAEHGKIVDDYWSKREPAGVALCCKRSRWGRLEWSLHRGMGNLAACQPAYSPLLLQIARDSVRANSLLRGMTQRMATANLFALSRDMIASLEAKDCGSALHAYKRDLNDIADFAGEAGKRAARIVYIKGLLGGLLAVTALLAALTYVFSSVSVPDVDSTLLVGCLIAGALGAVMSVLIRLSSGSLEVDHQFGREYLASLAGVRPFIGVAFALLLYFAFKANLLAQVNVPDHGSGEFAFYFTSGFLIGFSERFAKQIVHNAESGFAGGEQDGARRQEGAGSPTAPSLGGAPAPAMG
jgi:hypothetical protein